jgi:hypothetical protein
MPADGIGKLFALALVLTMLFIPASARAQEGSLRETFDNPDLPGWEHTPEVAAANGVLHRRPSTSAMHTITVRLAG